MKIQSGLAHDPGRRIWEIRDAAGAVLTSFNSKQFYHIFPGAEVYFIDFDIDPTFCDNVQGKLQVDGLVATATPANGIDAEAEAALRTYIMGALLSALKRQGQAQVTYMQHLEGKLQRVASEAPAAKLTLAYLKAAGIA